MEPTEMLEMALEYYAGLWKRILTMWYVGQYCDREHVVCVGFQDFGCSFGLPKLVATYGESSKSRFKPAATLSPRPRWVPSHILEHESDDELLLSSQNCMGGDMISSSKRVVKGKKLDTVPVEDETLYVNGCVLDAHPGCKSLSLSAVRGLRFTKNKKRSLLATPSEVAPPLSSFTNSQDLFKLISEDIEILDDSFPDGSFSSRQRH